MNILIIGQCTLHWGRMEFGNIGNYYIIEPFIRELHLAFPGANIKTTLQMSERFCKDEQIEVLPIDLYYAWRDNELDLAKYELGLSEDYKKNKILVGKTPYIEAVLWADLVVDFSGDIWGDNANFLGPDRFAVGLIKDKVAMNLGKKVVMLAGSPGPFSDEKTTQLAKEVYENFDLVTNREPLSTSLLKAAGFNMDRTSTLACPAFLFEPAVGPDIDRLLLSLGLLEAEKLSIGFILCGWNFEDGPFDKWPRQESEYSKFAEVIEYLTLELGARVYLISHSNGFDIPPAPFELKHGRDYTVLKQLENVLLKRGMARDVIALNGVYDAWTTKAIIGAFDMLISGRVHGAVAGLSQGVPTVLIDYGHEPKAHKILGFANVASAAEYVVNPRDVIDMKEKISRCLEVKGQYKAKIDQTIPAVKALARNNFSMLKEIFYE